MGDDLAAPTPTVRADDLLTARRSWARLRRRTAAVIALLLCALGVMPLCAIGLVTAPAHGQSAEPKQFAVIIKQRQVEPALRVIRALQGDTLDITIASDEAAELHLHGYDLLLSVEPGKPAAIHLVAKIAGRFSLEAHRFGTPGVADPHRQKEVTLLYLEIYPR